MEEQFKFGENVVVWDDGMVQKMVKRFIAHVGGIYPYLATNDADFKELVTGEDQAPVAAYKNCRKANPMQKYEEAISKSGFDNHEVVDIFFNLIEARNAVWETDDWKPYWDDGIKKYCIEKNSSGFLTAIRYSIFSAFAFKTEEICQWFISKFEKELGVLLENNLM